MIWFSKFKFFLSNITNKIQIRSTYLSCSSKNEKAKIWILYVHNRTIFRKTIAYIFCVFIHILLRIFFHLLRIEKVMSSANKFEVPLSSRSKISSMNMTNSHGPKSVSWSTSILTAPIPLPAYNIFMKLLS